MKWGLARRVRGDEIPAESMAWRINGERAVLLGWAPAMLMQFAHPLVAAGVADHSVAIADPTKRLYRLRRTIEAMLALTFGTPAQAADAARGINAIHDRVHGRLRGSAGIFPAATRYSAHDPALLLWVHATLAYMLPRAYHHYVGPLTPEEWDRLCAEGVGMSAVLGISEREMPHSVAELRRYLDEMWSSGAIAVSPTARALAHEMFRPPLGPLVYLSTVGLLPPAFRQAYGLRWAAWHELLFRLSSAVIRRLTPLLPAPLRYWGIAREAMHTREPQRMHTPAAPKLTARHVAR